MKKKLVIAFCVAALGLGGTTRVAAESSSDGLSMVADAVIARPLCLAATAIGTAFFIVSLPVSLPARSVNKAAHTLVVAPAKATFTRPLGDLDSLKD